LLDPVPFQSRLFPQLYLAFFAFGCILYPIDRGYLSFLLGPRPDENSPPLATRLHVCRFSRRTGFLMKAPPTFLFLRCLPRKHSLRVAFYSSFSRVGGSPCHPVVRLRSFHPLVLFWSGFFRPPPLFFPYCFPFLPSISGTHGLPCALAPLPLPGFTSCFSLFF